MIKWYDHPDMVPVSRAILQDDLEQKWPDNQFGIHIHQPGRRSADQYQIYWDGGPTNEEVLEFINKWYSERPFFTVDLICTTAHECGKAEE